MIDSAVKRKSPVRAKLQIPEARGLLRHRLNDLLAGEVSAHRAVFVIAPAGSGKTTLLSQFASGVPDPVAWYRAETSDGEPEAFLTYLEGALASAHPELGGGWSTIEDAVRAVEECPKVKLLLIIDDLHTVRGSPAESLLGRLVELMPPNLTILGASRTAPDLRLSKLRLDNSLMELGAEDLRFRSWEVERLFWEFYEARLPPEELAELARRTGGWAAGLQLFHLATRDKTCIQRRKMLRALAVRAPLARDYLSQNVIDGLPPSLRTFLVQTSVLGRVSAALCDTFLGTKGSAKLLAELENRQLFTESLGDDDLYSYHEVLRSYLQCLLLQELGEDECRAQFLRAAHLLEGQGAVEDALYAYCRAGAWEAVGETLSKNGEQLSTNTGVWIDELPSAVRTQDPWVLLATARRCRDWGQWKKALGLYRQAENAFLNEAGRQLCSRERSVLASWIESSPSRDDDLSAIVRSAASEYPLRSGELAAHRPGVSGRLAAGLCYLLGGHLSEARSLLSAVVQSSDAGQAVVAGARIGRAVAALLSGETEAKEELELAAKEAEFIGAAWLVRISTAALALSDRPGALEDAAAVHAAFVRDEDLWGSSIAGFFEGMGALIHGVCRPFVFAEAAQGFRELGAATLEAWCLLGEALMNTQQGVPDAASRFRNAEVLADSVGVGASTALCQLVQRSKGGVQSPEQIEMRGNGLPVRQGRISKPVESQEPEFPGASSILIRCFGEFGIELDGRPIDLTGLKPRPRQLLHLLSLRYGEWVHKEVLLEALWPDAGIESGTRSLHVAVSAVRQALGFAAPADCGRIIRREGNAYRFFVPGARSHDVQQFSDLCKVGAAARRAGEMGKALTAFQQAVNLYGGELLPEEGPAEWVVSARELYKSKAADAAECLAEIQAGRGEFGAAALSAEWGLKVDGCRDPLWRLLIKAYERGEQFAAAAEARRRYAVVLTELGVVSSNYSD